MAPIPAIIERVIVMDDGSARLVLQADDIRHTLPTITLLKPPLQVDVIEGVRVQFEAAKLWMGGHVWAERVAGNYNLFRLTPRVQKKGKLKP